MNVVYVHVTCTRYNEVLVRADKPVVWAVLCQQKLLRSAIHSIMAVSNCYFGEVKDHMQLWTT